MMQAEIRAGYERDGFVFPLDVMASDEAEEYRLRLETIETRYADRLPVQRYFHYDPHYLLPVADESQRRERP